MPTIFLVSQRFEDGRYECRDENCFHTPGADDLITWKTRRVIVPRTIPHCLGCPIQHFTTRPALTTGENSNLEIPRSCARLRFPVNLCTSSRPTFYLVLVTLLSPPSCRAFVSNSKANDNFTAPLTPS